jgi:hypothetical protein
MNPAARFLLATPLATPLVSVDAITTGDPRAASSGGHGGGAIDVGTLLLLGIALLAHGSAIRSSHQTGASPRDGG